MPRSAGTAVENNFSKGLITEATGLSFPENACTETYDCIFLPTGQVTRRPGFDLEPGFGEVVPYTNTTGVIKEYVWQVASVSTSTIFQVVQAGPIVQFFLNTASNLGPNLQSFEIDLTDYETSSVIDTGDLPCSFSSGNGLLFIAHPQVEPLMVEYDADTNDITVTELSLKVRDFAGVEDGLAVETRPSTLTDLHHYNLKNQGWWPASVLAVDNSNVYTQENPILWFEDTWTVYPANNQQWWAYKRARSDVSTASYQEAFDPVVATYIQVGNSPAPKGHYILDAFNMDRTTASGVSNIPTETSGGARPQAVAFFAGRAFWGGVAAQGFSSKVYFSQIVERNSQVALCYQNFDPTDEEVADLLPSDGGVIIIPEMRQLHMMVPLADALFLFASNGVWKIAGSEGIGFRANDYSIMKVSEVGAISNLSFVLVENMPVWWNHAGIWTLATENGIDYTVRSLTDVSIKAFFEDIPNDSKYYAKGAYNTQSKVIQWLYRSTESEDDTPAEQFQYDRILNLNTITAAFYPWQISGGDEVIVRGITAIQGLELRQEIEEVFSGSDEVLVGEDTVITPVDTFRAVQSLFKYIVHLPDGIGGSASGYVFADCARVDYVDWRTATSGYDYTSYFISGYRINADGDKRFQSNYVTVNYEAEAHGGGYIQGVWDYATSGDTGRWSSKQPFMNYTENYTHLMSKRKIRGNGRALQLQFTSQPGKPFKVNGWTIFLTGNQTV